MYIVYSNVLSVIVFLFQLEDCGLQLSHTGTYLDLESSIDEQKEDFEGFNKE